MHHTKMPHCSSSCNQKCKSCVDCTCGDNCQCTETLCRCEASSILNSLQESSSVEALLHVDGMTCQSCVKTVAAVCHTSADHVSLETGKVTCEVSSRQEALELVEELRDVGFEATLERVGNTVATAETICHASDSPLSDAIPATPCSSSSDVNTNLFSSPLFEGAATWTARQQQDPLLEQPSSSPPLSPQRQHDNDETVVEMVVSGMTCTMCSTAITRALQSVEGVTSANVNLTTNIATIHYNPMIVSIDVLKETITNVGYTVDQVLNANQQDTRLQDLAQRQEEQVQQKKQVFLYSLMGTLPIFSMTMILPHLLPNPILSYLHSTITILGYNIQRESLLLWILATPVQFGCGWTFYKSSYYNVQSGNLGMDVLVALGTTASYFYAVYETLEGQSGHFFETSAVLLSFVLLGKWMNALAVTRTSQALTKLMKLQSKRAIRVTPKKQDYQGNDPWDPIQDGYDELVVDISVVQPNDTVKILRGASIPADGVVSHGEMTVDESMITGESIPVLKLPGSIVLGGTVCVECEDAAAGFVQVTGVGASTALAQIVQLVQDAQTRQVPIQSLADTISSVFVPTVCACSVVTYMVWYALCSSGVVPKEWFIKEGAGTFSLMFAIACLVISCPCALGLATPTVRT